MKVDCVAAIPIALFCCGENAVHTSFADGSALIFPGTAVFNAFSLSHLPACQFHLLFDCEWGEFSILLLPQMSFVSWSWYVFLLSLLNAIHSSIRFALFRFQLNKIKWGVSVCAHLQAKKKRTYHLQSAPQNTASNWAKLFLRCVCVCTSGCVCRFHVPDGEISVRCAMSLF